MALNDVHCLPPKAGIWVPPPPPRPSPLPQAWRSDVCISCMFIPSVTQQHCLHTSHQLLGQVLRLWGACPVHPLNVHSTCNQNRSLKSCGGDSDEHFQLLFFLLLFSLPTTLPGTVGKASHYVLDFLSSHSQASLLLKHLPGLPFPTESAPPPPSTLYAPCSLSGCGSPLLLLQGGPSPPGPALCFLCLAAA